LATVKFLQISDLHLGARFAWLPRERRAERRKEQQRALEHALQTAIERGVDAVLVPGDLFDREEVDAETFAFAIHVLGMTGCPPVFVAPGNHDPWSETSPMWNPRLVAARGWRWPAHVHVFATPTFASVRLDGLSVRIWGRCFTPRMASTERPLDPAARAALGALSATELHVAVFHGSLEGDVPPGQKLVAPFSAEEAERAPFAYLAVGHYHRREVRDHFAYAGSAVALDVTETGAHGALEVRVEFGNGPAAVVIEPIELDSRRVHALEIDVTAASSADQIDARILDALDQAQVPERDLVRVRLVGRLARGVRYGAPGETLSGRVHHLRLDLAAVRPDWDLASLRGANDETTEGRFARVLLARLDEATDPGARARLERALYYGLDAFRLREVMPGYEEIAE